MMLPKYSKKVYLFAALFVISLFAVAAFALQTKSSDKVAVSLIQLIANPDTFEGVRVRVWGYAVFTSQQSILYLHYEDYKQGLTKNGLWIRVNLEAEDKRQEYNRRYVLLEGTFISDTGDLGLCSGSLDKVTILAWKRPIFLQ